MDKILGNITPILTKGIDNLTLAQTKNAGDAENIAKEKGKDYELVISLGGDGTLHEVINGLGAIKKPPIIGVLPAGTCNDFARGLNIPLKLEDAAEKIIEGKIKNIDIGKVNNRYFTNFVGAGLITDISENINSDSKNIMGRISYYTSAIRSMSDKKPFKFTLKTEKEKIKDNAAMVIVVNGNHVGSKYVPVKSISMTDGYFDVFILYD
ncbi:MAG: diacylglycerol/lipid kinase family protein, partial [Senegalia sp. (in: firmicutes)]